MSGKPAKCYNSWVPSRKSGCVCTYIFYNTAGWYTRMYTYIYSIIYVLYVIIIIINTVPIHREYNIIYINL